MRNLQKKFGSILAVLLLFLISAYFGSYLAIRFGIANSILAGGRPALSSPVSSSSSVHWIVTGGQFGISRSERAILVGRPFSKVIFVFRPCLWIEGRLTGKTIKMFDLTMLTQ